jgi:hypothetical protein
VGTEDAGAVEESFWLIRRTILRIVLHYLHIYFHRFVLLASVRFKNVSFSKSPLKCR